DPRRACIDQQTLLRQGAHAIGFGGEQVEFGPVQCLRRVLRHQNGLPFKLSEPAISDGGQKRPQPFVHDGAGLHLEHHQRRMGGEQAVSSFNNLSSSPSASILIKSIDGHPRTALSKSRLVTRTGSLASAVESARNSLDVANARFPSLSPSERAAPTISRLGRDRRQCGWDRNGQIAKTQPEIELLACFSRFGRTHTTAFGRNFRCPLGYRAASIV